MNSKTLSLSFLLLTPLTAPCAENDPINIGTRRELFVDDFLIDKMKGADRRLHRPTPQEVSIVHDAPWEGSACAYHTVFQDGAVYRMYYRGLHLQVNKGSITTASHEPFYCYAESKDGIHWIKPNLGIIEFKGSNKNNIILKGRGTHNFSPLIDTNPNCPPEARYKAIGGLQSEGGLFAFQSADGIHWSLMSDKPVITNGAFDSQNVAFWDATIEKYRAYWRYFTGGVTTKEEWKPAGLRAIRTAVSDDFLTWKGDVDLTYVDSPHEQLYTNQVKPYYRTPHILIGFPLRYVDRGWSASMRALPEREQREFRAQANRRYGTAITETLIMASRDGVRFERWNEAFLRPGMERPGTWQYGHQAMALQVVETQSSLPGASPELSLYANEGGWQTKGRTVRRYTLRLDGFVSLYAPMKGGEFITRPLEFSGSKLSVNFATSAAGGIRAEIQQPDGTPIKGFHLTDCPEHFGDTVNRAVTWKGGNDVSRLAGKPVRLRFELKDADLYSFQFRGEQ